MNYSLSNHGICDISKYNTGGGGVGYISFFITFLFKSWGLIGVMFSSFSTARRLATYLFLN